MWVREAGYQCSHYPTAKKFFQAIQQETYDIAILDWELPDMVGDEILDTLRNTLNLQIPIICTTVRDEEENIVKALQLGADDYMTKPLSRNELMARLEALSRRTQGSPDKQINLEFPPFQFHLESHTLTKNSENIVVTDKEFHLAKLLFQNAGRMLSRNFLLEMVWGTRGDLDTRTVDTHVSRLRKKLVITPDAGWRLTPVYKYGYRLEKLADHSEQ